MEDCCKGKSAYLDILYAFGSDGINLRLCDAGRFQRLQ